MDSVPISAVEEGQRRNRLLSAMAQSDLAALLAGSAPVSMKMGEILLAPGQKLDTVLFPERGFISFVSPGKVETELGLIGWEGALGASLILGVDRIPLKAVCQMAGSGIAVRADAFLAVVESSPSLRLLLGRYLHAFMMQTASTAYANSNFTVEQRLARWLLLMRDRVDCDDLEVTHEFLALMLGVRRPGVTVATHMLEGNHLIRARRGRLTILDRAGLETLAQDSYGLSEAEYARVIHPAAAQAG